MTGRQHYMLLASAHHASSANKKLPMFADAQRDLLERYKRSIDEIIQRYKHIDDTYDEIVNIDQSDELDTLQLQDVSFIKKGTRKTCAGLHLLSLEDIHARLCTASDFEDVVHFLC